MGWQKQPVKRWITMSILLVLIATSILVLVILNSSFTKYNVYPKKELKQYLEGTYEGNFTFLSQEYSITNNRRYHVWELLFADEQGTEFHEYFYIKNIGSRLATAMQKEYGMIWDTYTQLHLEKKYGNILDFESVRNKETPQDTYIESHYDFVIENESDIEKTIETLALLYYDTIHFAKTINGAILVSVVWNGENDIICIIYLNRIIDYLQKGVDDDILQEEIKDYITLRINEKL